MIGCRFLNILDGCGNIVVPEVHEESIDLLLSWFDGFTCCETVVQPDVGAECIHFERGHVGVPGVVECVSSFEIEVALFFCEDFRWAVDANQTHVAEFRAVVLRVDGHAGSGRVTVVESHPAECRSLYGACFLCPLDEVWTSGNDGIGRFEIQVERVALDTSHVRVVLQVACVEFHESSPL